MPDIISIDRSEHEDFQSGDIFYGIIFSDNLISSLVKARFIRHDTTTKSKKKIFVVVAKVLSGNPEELAVPESVVLVKSNLVAYKSHDKWLENIMKVREYETSELNLFYNNLINSIEK